MDKQIENAMNRLINTEIWSSNLYLAMQVFFERNGFPVLSSWLQLQSRGNMERVHAIMHLLYHQGGTTDIAPQEGHMPEWRNSTGALNRLVEQEQNVQRDVKSFLFAVHYLDKDLYTSIRHLYDDRPYIGNILLELMHILAEESQRRLPE